MPKPGQPTIIVLQKKISEYGFAKTGRFYPELTYMVTHSQESSLTVELMYGHWKIDITIFKLKFDFSILDRVMVGEGGFGKVEQLIVGDRKYAAKNIKVKMDDSAQIQKVYQEVFCLKFADALRVGPKFYQLYGYDVLEVAGKSMVFTMELCELDYTGFLFPRSQQKSIKQKTYSIF